MQRPPPASAQRPTPCAEWTRQAPTVKTLAARPCLSVDAPHGAARNGVGGRRRWAAGSGSVSAATARRLSAFVLCDIANRRHLGAGVRRDACGRGAPTGRAGQSGVAVEPALRRASSWCGMRGAASCAVACGTRGAASGEERGLVPAAGSGSSTARRCAGGGASGHQPQARSYMHQEERGAPPPVFDAGQTGRGAGGEPGSRVGVSRRTRGRRRGARARTSKARRRTTSSSPRGPGHRTGSPLGTAVGRRFATSQNTPTTAAFGGPPRLRRYGTCRGRPERGRWAEALGRGFGLGQRGHGTSVVGFCVLRHWPHRLRHHRWGPAEPAREGSGHEDAPVPEDVRRPAWALRGLTGGGYAWGWAI